MFNKFPDNLQSVNKWSEKQQNERMSTMLKFFHPYSAKILLIFNGR